MIHYFLKTTQFIPNEFHNSFFDIDFTKLYRSGYRLILSDLDNTLIPYDLDEPNEELNNKIKELQDIGFEVVLLSNNIPARINKFLKGTTIKGYANARKPLLIGVKKAFNSSPIHDKTKTIIIGDQLMTDIWAANRFNVYSILVNPIKKKTEKWYTKMNRKTEVKMLHKIQKKYPNQFSTLGLDKRA